MTTLSLLASTWFAVSACAQVSPVPAKIVVVARVADAATWAKLRDRAVKRADSVQQTAINGTKYVIRAVVSDEALPGQSCPAGTTPKNAVYFTSPAPKADQALDIYPVRLTSGCAVADDGTFHDILTVDADYAGKILDISVYNGSLGLITHPSAEPIPLPGDTQTSSLQSFLGRLVKHLTAAP